MKVYMYQAALYCQDCGDAIRAELGYSLDSTPETEYDSGEYPKGPFPDGGGEADSPSHCDCCNVHLENPLTGDGEQYVRESLDSGEGWGAVLSDWAEFYSYLF